MCKNFLKPEKRKEGGKSKMEDRRMKKNKIEKSNKIKESKRNYFDCIGNNDSSANHFSSN